MSLFTRAAVLAIAASTATAAQADFTISPRFFLYFDNASQRQSGFDELSSLAEQENVESSQELSDFFGTPITVTTDNVTSASISNQIVYPLFGGAFTADLDQAKRTQVSVSVLYGKASSDIKALNTIEQTVTVEGFEAEDILSLSQTGKIKTKRLDIEATIQRRLNERVALLGGLRYERLNSRGEFDVSFTSSNNAANLFELLYGVGDISIGLSNSEGESFVRATDNIYSVRFGGAAFAPIAQRNLVYVNGLLHLTHQANAKGESRFIVEDVDMDETNEIQVKSETSMGPDITVGYFHRITDGMGIDVRYRGIFYFPVSGNRDLDDPRVNHGLNVGLNFSI